ncbi:MAG: DEAD/DEAH box helicase, partial [Proteobacteria bacterium]|nr:DEAD/DEAH box helicase [Pseudomonadota bacterium]
MAPGKANPPSAAQPQGGDRVSSGSASGQGLRSLLHSTILELSSLVGESIAPGNFTTKLDQTPLSALKRSYAVRWKLLRDCLRSTQSEPADGVQRLRILNNIERYIDRYEQGTERTLRPLQMEVFKSLHTSLERGVNSGYIRLPTGSGKTAIFSEFVEAIGGRSLIVVPTNQLVDQTVAAMRKFAPDAAVSTYNGDSKDLSGAVVIITYDSLVRAMRAGAISAADFGAAIFDESHRALSTLRQEVVAEFQKHCITLGFTATPEFNEIKSAQNLFGEPYYEMTLREAVGHGLLCPARSVLAVTDVDVSKVRLRGDGSFNEGELERALNKEAFNKGAVKVYQEYFSGRTGVAFCAGVEHAKEVAKQFAASGVAAAATWGGDPELDTKLAQLRNGEIKLLCNARLLIEGFDDCGISVCLNLAPTTSIVNAEQRGGRVMRLNEHDTLKQAFIVDFLPKKMPDGIAPVTFTEVMGGTALGMVTPLPQEIKRDGDAAGSTPLPAIEGVEVILERVSIERFLEHQRLDAAHLAKLRAAPDGWIPLRDLSPLFPEIPVEMVPRLVRELVGPLETSTQQHAAEELIRRYPHGPLNNLVEFASPDL